MKSLFIYKIISDNNYGLFESLAYVKHCNRFTLILTPVRGIKRSAPARRRREGEGFDARNKLRHRQRR